MSIISTKYPTLELTKFPNEIDTQYIMVDPSASDLAAIQQYNTLYDAGDLVGANAVLTANPSLNNMILNASKMNRLEQMIIAIEKYYFEDVQTFMLNAAGINAGSLVFATGETLEEFKTATNAAIAQAETDAVASAQAMADLKVDKTSISDAVNIDDSTKVASAKAVKAANDNANGREPAINKQSGFNLPKSDVINSANSSVLATSKAAKTAYDKGVQAKAAADNALSVANGKEPAIGTKHSGFNLSKSDTVTSSSSSVLATQKAVNTVYNTANLKEPKLSTDQKRKITYSWSAPASSYGNSGDIHIKMI